MAKDNVTTPSKAEIAKLPRWAQIAFAARCARRVQPLYAHSWPDAPQNHIDNLDKAITLVGASAAIPAPTSEQAYANAAANAANAAANAYAANAAANAYAANAAANANAYAANAAKAAYVASNAISAINVIKATNDNAYKVKYEIQRDYELLQALTQQDGWDDDTPVPPEVFGPMWPDELPVGWPSKKQNQQKTSKKLVIQVAVPCDVDDDDLDEALITLAEDASRLHMAHGGAGLVIKSVHVFDEAHVPSEVHS